MDLRRDFLPELVPAGPDEFRDLPSVFAPEPAHPFFLLRRMAVAGIRYVIRRLQTGPLQEKLRHRVVHHLPVQQSCRIEPVGPVESGETIIPAQFRHLRAEDLFTQRPVVLCGDRIQPAAVTEIFDHFLMVTQPFRTECAPVIAGEHREISRHPAFLQVPDQFAQLKIRPFLALPLFVPRMRIA